jgi:hypothetical protein
LHSLSNPEEEEAEREDDGRRRGRRGSKAVNEVDAERDRASERRRRRQDTPIKLSAVLCSFLANAVSKDRRILRFWLLGKPPACPANGLWSKALLDTLGARQAAAASLGTGWAEPGISEAGVFNPRDPDTSICRQCNGREGGVVMSIVGESLLNTRDEA